jgi:hypothetical protein
VEQLLGQCGAHPERICDNTLPLDAVDASTSLKKIQIPTVILLCATAVLAVPWCRPQYATDEGAAAADPSLRPNSTARRLATMDARRT